jgi:hypothetical protein
MIDLNRYFGGMRRDLSSVPGRRRTAGTPGDLWAQQGCECVVGPGLTTFVCAE